MSKQLTIAEISQLIQNNHLSNSEIAKLKQDDRKGVQKLIQSYERQIANKLQLETKYREMLIYENNQYEKGFDFVAGIDEAGRGPLAGPVVAAAVILPKEFILPGLNDSKQLSKQVREEFFTAIKENAVTYGIGIIHSNEIDEINIYEATKKAMKSAIQQLSPIPDHVLIDAVPLKDLPCTSESITKGDQKSVSIAAASILAKVTRDHIMEEIHHTYPVYNFISNKGYGSKEHMDAISQYGACKHHRKSFAPIKQLYMD